MDVRIETERLLLRPARTSDVDALIERRNDPEVAELQDWPMPCEREAAEELLAGAVAMEGPAPGEWWMFTIADRADTEVLGDFNVRLSRDGVATIGYALARNSWGQGLASEALDAVARWLFESHAIVRIDATIHPKNFRSMRMVENCGFVLAGVDYNTQWDRHGLVDDQRYSLTPELYAEWSGRPQHAPKEVELKELDPNDVRSVIELVTHPSQRRFASPIVVSLAEAAVPPYEFNSDGTHGSPQVVPWHRIIHADGKPVGFLMIETPTETDPEPFLWRLLIDRRHQRRGIGKRAVELAVEQARSWGSASLMVSYGEGIGSPEPLYTAMGFIPTGEIEEGEMVARLLL